jgi:hypothetical protein
LSSRRDLHLPLLFLFVIPQGSASAVAFFVCHPAGICICRCFFCLSSRRDLHFAAATTLLNPQKNLFCPTRVYSVVSERDADFLHLNLL